MLFSSFYRARLSPPVFLLKIKKFNAYTVAPFLKRIGAGMR